VGRDVLEWGASMLPPVVLDMALHWRSVRAGTGAVPERGSKEVLTGPGAEGRSGGIKNRGPELLRFCRAAPADTICRGFFKRPRPKVTVVCRNGTTLSTRGNYTGFRGYFFRLLSGVLFVCARPTGEKLA